MGLLGTSTNTPTEYVLKDEYDFNAGIRYPVSFVDTSVPSKVRINRWLRITLPRKSQIVWVCGHINW